MRSHATENTYLFLPGSRTYCLLAARNNSNENRKSLSQIRVTGNDNEYANAYKISLIRRKLDRSAGESTKSSPNVEGIGKTTSGNRRNFQF